MKLLHPHEYRAMPWRNGGGVTHEIHAGPSTHEDHDFDWRASIAELHNDRPFSEYRDVERSIVLIGDGSASLVANRVAVALTADSQPFCFAGEDKVDVAVADKPVLVFNLMSRRGIGHKLARRTCSPETRFARNAATQLLFALDDDHLMVEGVARPRHSGVVIKPHGSIGPDLAIAFAGHGAVLHAEIN